MKRFPPNVGVSQPYQQLSWPRFRHIQLDQFGRYFTRGVIDAGLVLLGKIDVGHSW